ncbi:hypothetical protein FRC01_012752 [Tulasnella sp. 417]|nr:hypothetical protein FRC01_012752 [Tulasnella sp. 417]
MKCSDINCPQCKQPFDSDGVLAHCFPCGHLVCLDCIGGLPKLGCLENCPLPDGWIPSRYRASDIPQLNVQFTQRVHVDFTGIANLLHRVVQQEQLTAKQNELTKKEKILQQTLQESEAYKRLLEDEVSRRDGETRETFINVVTAKLDELSSDLKPLLALAEHIDVEALADVLFGSGPPSPIRLRPITKAELASVIGGDASSPPELQAPQSPSPVQPDLSSNAAASSPTLPSA